MPVSVWLQPIATPPPGEFHIEHVDYRLPDPRLTGSTLIALEEPRDAALDKFVAWWESLEDPMPGNSALRDFMSFWIIALCAMLSSAKVASG
jgi:hypothetical protein